MMLLGDKKKLSAAIVGEYKPQSKDIEPDFSGAIDGLASDILNAIEVKDSAMLAKALSNFMQMCGKEEEYREG